MLHHYKYFYYCRSNQTLVNKSYIAKVEQDEDGEFHIVFPDMLLESMGWDKNTILEWVNNNDGTFSIKKVEENVKFGRA